MTITFTATKAGSTTRKVFSGKGARNAALDFISMQYGGWILSERTETIHGPEFYTTLWMDGALDTLAMAKRNPNG